MTWNIDIDELHRAMDRRGPYRTTGSEQLHSMLLLAIAERLESIYEELNKKKK